jgi:thiol-disulfide isomerase/thioredoxin
VSRCLSFVLMMMLLGASSVTARSLAVGDPIPDFAVVDWQGAPRRLTEWRGSAVVVEFWATWCGVCRGGLTALDALARRHQGRLQVLAVNIDQNAAAADRFVAEHVPDPAMVMLRDPGGAMMAEFGASGMPVLYLFGRDGTIRFIESGYSAEGLAAFEARLPTFIGSATSPPPDTRGPTATGGD